MEDFANDPQFERLKSRLQQNPDSLLFARVAEGLLNRGQVEEAIRVCEEGIRKHPYYITGHMVLGKCYLQKKLFDLAEKEFKRVLLFDPKYIAAHKFYGDLMREVGWENTYEMSYRKILQIDPLDHSVREMLETLEKVKPRKEVVSPGVGPLTRHDNASETTVGQPAEVSQVQEEEEFSTLSGETDEELSAEPINLEDDLFADIDEPEGGQTLEQTPPSSRLETEDVSGILDEIFEEEKETINESPDLDTFSIDEEPAEALTAPESEEDIEPDPMATLDRFEEETLEIDRYQEPAPPKSNITDQIFPYSGEEKTGGVDVFSAGEDQMESSSEETLDEEAWDSELLSMDMPEEDGENAFEIGEEADETGQVAEWDAETGAETVGEAGTEAESPEWEEEELSLAPGAVKEELPGGGQQRDDEPTPADGTSRPDAPTEAASEERERIVTPTLGEIYAAQGQFAKAINVFELLLKKDPNNQAYKEKIKMLKQRLEESQNA